MLRKGKITDANALAKIHLLELRSDFLASLGEKFLRLLYVSILRSKDAYVWVEYSDNFIQGFIVGSKNFDTLFKKIVIKNFLKFSLVIVPQIIRRPVIIKNVFETFFYIKREDARKIKAELVVISVLKKYHRKGLGRKLILALEKDFISQGIKKYKLTVNAVNLAANEFYKSLMFKKNHYFFIYGKKLNLYTKIIK